MPTLPDNLPPRSYSTPLDRFSVNGYAYEGSVLIRYPNDDKTFDGDKLISLSLGLAKTVLVAYDERASQIPGWLKDWQRSDEILNGTDHNVNYRVFSKKF